MKLLRGYLQPSVLKKRHLLLKDDIAALIASERERKLGAQEAASSSSNLPDERAEGSRVATRGYACFSSNLFTAAACHRGSRRYVDPAGALAMRADVVVDPPCCMAGSAFGPLVFANCGADNPGASRRIRKRPAALLADFVERSHGSAASRTDPDRPSKGLHDRNDRAYKD